MNKELRNWITSEQFIHDGLLQKCETLIQKLYDLWKQEKKITSSLLLWPGEEIKGDDGNTFANIVFMDLPNTNSWQKELIAKSILRTKAYAFFAVRQTPEEVLALFESPHGTRSWRLPVQRSGDVCYLGKASSKDDAEGLSLLWSNKQSRA